MAIFLTIGGLLGSAAGVWLFSALKKIGQLDLVISVFYVLFLTTVGSLMAVESISHMLAKKKGIVLGKRQIPHWIKHGRLPITEHVKLTSSCVLTVNHVFDIIATYLKTNDWKVTLETSIP